MSGIKIQEGSISIGPVGLEILNRRLGILEPRVGKSAVIPKLYVPIRVPGFFEALGTKLDRLTVWVATKIEALVSKLRR